MLSNATAQRLNISAGQTVSFAVGAEKFALPAQLSAVFPDAAIGLPSGITGVPIIAAGNVATQVGSAA
jgi:hypothetical protein